MVEERYNLKNAAVKRILQEPNGRFETQTKICLSISNHHPEHWQPSWSEFWKASSRCFVAL
ncbi:hypothetical protein H6P81_010547 [Aristolochia fimbriata]|uniref:Uncharacterized protein n=1 Tax=Aristolochia fimbriata TaxID=158543 RepID=A0AAV7ESH0_ARIFI|nr:hypothetical protein H6P81_010547 [Aristolochia fimbriata]